MGSDLNSESIVRQTVLQLLHGTRLTVLSSCENKVQVCKREASLQHHGDFLLAAPILDQLGLPTASGSSPPLSSRSGLPLFMFSVHSSLLTVREKPLPETCFDSFVHLNSSLIVDTPDLSSTCIEFEGHLAGRPVRVLL